MRYDAACSEPARSPSARSPHDGAVLAGVNRERAAGEHDPLAHTAQPEAVADRVGVEAEPSSCDDARALGERIGT